MINIICALIIVTEDIHNSCLIIFLVFHINSIVINLRLTAAHQIFFKAVLFYFFMALFTFILFDHFDGLTMVGGPANDNDVI